MSNNPNKLSNFWNELKRRRVVHVITVYASAAFVIIELVNNLSEPLNLPPSLATVVIIVLAAGFPLAVILSWLYDLTDEGIQRTLPLEETNGAQKAQVTNAWKTATFVSFIVILVLLTLHILGGTKKLQAGDIQSLVVLPFENFTGDEQMDNVVSGMHALLVGDMGRISEVRVTGKTTSNAYKDVDLSATEIASELNVDAVLEASVMCFGDSVCMQFRLVQTTGEEKQLWVADFMEDKNQIPNLYNRITKQIAEEIIVELTPEEEHLLNKSITVDREAYDSFLKSRQYWDDASFESLNKARESLNTAIEKDPDWAPLYAGLAQVWLGLSQFGFESPAIAAPHIFKNLDKALELDPDHAEAHFLNAMVAYLAEWNWEKAEKEFLKAIALNPNDAYSRIYYAHLLYILQRPEEAAVQARLSYELEPLDPTILVTYAASLLCADDCESALIYAEKVLEIEPENFLAYNQINSVTFRCGDYDRTFESDMLILRGLSREEFDEDTFKEIERIFQKQGYFAAYAMIMDCYEELAQKGFVGAGTMAINYITGNYQDKALDYLEKGFKIHDPQMPYIASGGYPFHSLYDHPRFIAILEKMNLPLPVN